MPDLQRQVPSFQRALLTWYDRSARDLPWRRAPSLYKTVVSEFMLQQTQVKTALPYFHAWLEAFPDFATLAQADEPAVLKRWEGLGYYSRARNLLKLAREISAYPPEDVPKDATSWLAFPGVGPYAAAAICSISFDQPAAVVDGNVVRILARLQADGTPYKNSSEAAKAYRPLADRLLNHERPGDHNQAMMELGATVCHKRSPQCLICPVAAFCDAKARGIAESLPVLQKTIYEDRVVERAWIRGPKGVLLHKIPDSAKRMKGLHELPLLEHLNGNSPSTSAPILQKKRSITRYRITERIYELPPGSLLPDPPADCIWASPEEIAELPFSGPHRRWISELLKRSATA